MAREASTGTQPTSATQKRAQQWQQAQDYLMQNGPWASVIQPGVYIATRANIGGYVWNPQWRVNPYIISKSSQ